MLPQNSVTGLMLAYSGWNVSAFTAALLTMVISLPLAEGVCAGEHVQSSITADVPAHREQVELGYRL